MASITCRGKWYPLAAELSKSPQAEWKLVYADSKGFIFMRHPPPGVEPLTPCQRCSKAWKSSAVSTCCTTPRVPAAPRMSELYAHVGDTAHASQWMTRYLEHRVGPDRRANKYPSRCRSRC